MATHSSILACRMPWAEEPGGLQPMGLQAVGHNRASNAITTTMSHRRPLAGWLKIGVRDRINSHREQATWTQKQDVSGDRRRLLLQLDGLHGLRFLSQKRRKMAEKPRAGGAWGSSGRWGLSHFLVRWRVCLSMHFMFLNNRNRIKKNRDTLSH